MHQQGCCVECLKCVGVSSRGTPRRVADFTKQANIITVLISACLLHQSHRVPGSATYSGTTTRLPGLQLLLCEFGVSLVGTLCVPVLLLLPQQAPQHSLTVLGYLSSLQEQPGRGPGLPGGMIDSTRIQKELREITNDTASGVTVDLVGDSLQHLVGSVPGPKDTPYDGGVFKVDIVLEDQYPFVPPKMKFITRVWHPNVSSASGAICLDILKDQWSPALTLKTALLSLQALLSSPQPDDPQDAVVAKQYLSDRATFDKTARYWTEAFANPNSGTLDAKVQKIVDMGFDRAAALQALNACNGDENAALESLLG